MQYVWLKHACLVMTAGSLLVIVSACGGSVTGSEDRDGTGGMAGTNASCIDFSIGSQPRSTDIDWDCDGTIDWHACDKLTYDPSGRVASSEQGCDNPSLCIRYTYDSKGRPKEENWDDDCNGTLERCNKHSYQDGTGNAWLDIDDGCDGHYDTCMALTLDECGNIETSAADELCDGIPEECKENTVLPDRYVMREGCGSQMNYCSTTLLDSRGWSTRNEFDHDCNGTIDNVVCYLYPGDDGGAGGAQP